MRGGGDHCAHIHLGEVAVALHAAQAAPPGCVYVGGWVVIVVVVVPVADRVQRGQDGVAGGMSNWQRERIKLQQQKVMQSAVAACGGQSLLSIYFWDLCKYADAVSSVHQNHCFLGIHPLAHGLEEQDTEDNFSRQISFQCVVFCVT